MDEQAFDSFATAYDAAVSIERTHDFFLANLPTRRECVLDVGCGSGVLSFELSRHFRHVVALDISEPMLAIARERRSASNIEYRLCDASAFSSEPVFDAVVSHTTFHHLADVSAVLARLRGCLAPGGRLILLDCVARLPRFIPRWNMLYRTHASLRFLPDVIRRGSTEARILLRFRSSQPWIAHRQSDRYLSRAEFRDVYGRALPGAQLTKLRSFMGVLWTAMDEGMEKP